MICDRPRLCFLQKWFRIVGRFELSAFEIKTGKLILRLISLLILTAAAGWAGSPDDTDSQSTLIYIDSIHVNNMNIFDLDSAKYDFWPFHLANKLHIRTKKHVIKRELLLNKGEPFSRRLADETERNLRALPYLWNARLSMVKGPAGENILEVATSDTWTLLGGLSFHRTAGENEIHFRAEEQNLLGMGQHLSFHHYFRDTLEDFSQFSFLERRLFNSRLFFQSYFNGDPEIAQTSLSLGKPFFSLNSKSSFRFDFIDWNRRDDYYESGLIIAQDKIKGSQFILTGAYRTGSYYDKVQFGTEIIYTDINVSAKKYLADSNLVTFPRDSLYYAVIPEFSIRSYEYLQTTRIDNFNRIEDILFLNGAAINYGRFFDRHGDKIYDYAGLLINYAKHFRANLFFVELGRNYWFNGRQDFRKRTNFSIRYYNNGISWLTPQVRLKYDEDFREDAMATLYLGENNGLRGYPKNISTGRKRILGNIENRIFPGLEFLSADFGAVQFIDFGRCWSFDRKLRLDDLLWSVGIGLRIGVERVTHAKTMRLDLAYAGKTRDWQVSFGLGQYIK
ncbi:MAG: hypothetical protein CVT49_14930 [candidate division Zixibacteria bacterium HGW-Zixibacteria-1]|nr:MAG: hypothetical protein CVT49_14930 [candidate division Zixibacteria bacterium HGW-Zixibacteria-1]